MSNCVFKRWGLLATSGRSRKTVLDGKVWFVNDFYERCLPTANIFLAKHFWIGFRRSHNFHPLLNPGYLASWHKASKSCSAMAASTACMKTVAHAVGLPRWGAV